MFKPVTPKLNIQALEEAQIEFWKKNKIFKKSSDDRRDRKPFVMFEGPPTANGKPGIHHVIGRVYKDMFPRYKTMQGFFVDRRGGWDTHGLPVEIEVEKKLGFTNKAQIEEYGIAKFNELCKESAMSRIHDWEAMTERIGYWVDFDRAYITFKNEYVESVWWLLKQIWDKGLLFKGHKIVPYCPRCGTPLADHEVAQGYKDAEDPSVYVRFQLAGEENTYFLVWTTTPWTLPANVAIAAHPEVEYVMVTREDGSDPEKLILAKDLVQTVFGDAAMKVVAAFKGTELRGKEYIPLYKFLPLPKKAHYVVNADYVTTSDGTGLVHIAPAFGADDYLVSEEYDLPMLKTVNDEGKFIDQVTPWKGIFVKNADPSIMQDLKSRGLLFNSGKITHTYPFCWRCDTPLLYMARLSWFIRTSAKKERMVQLNQGINWIPENIKNGRFGNWLENNIDWALGRNRYWGTPLPVWECDACHHQHCIGSVEELSRLSGRNLTGMDLHRPHVDEITFVCPSCQKGEMHRVKELIDVWFDSGAMPYAQWHYPFENKEAFESQYPADFICEAIDQTRGWFYSLLAESTLVFDKAPFKNVICYGHILDGEGKKMSKHVGNVVDPWDVLKAHGADAIRWYMVTASPPQNSRNFSIELVGEVVRNFILPLWNTYSFFVTYANLDGWTPNSGAKPKYSSLDEWLLSELNQLVADVTRAFDSYDVTGATRPIESFVEKLSNWYLRRSRRRYWKTEADDDKSAAYETLYTALKTIAYLLAPTMPFMAEELYQNLVAGVDPNAPESVHLAEWPKPDEERVDLKLNQEMETVMRLASLGHAARNKSNIKVRQPLAEVAFALGSAGENDLIEKYAEILTDELNVKKVRLLNNASEAVSYRINPLPKQIGQKYKALAPRIRQAILDLPVTEAAANLLSGKGIMVKVDEQCYEILPDEVEVHTDSQAGFAVATDGPYLAALDTTLTKPLIHEGLAREFVRHIQALRKDGGFEISDRIHVKYEASPELAEAIDKFRDYIMSETLALKMETGRGDSAWTQQEDSFDNNSVKVFIQKAEIAEPK